MPKKSAPRIYDHTSPFQRETKTALEDVGRKEILNGRFLEDVVLTTTPTKVSHGLSRTPRGWFITDITVNTNVYRDSTATERTKFLTLTAGAACTVSLWVF